MTRYWRLAKDAFRRVRRLPPRELAATAHALLLLVFVEATIRWVSLPRLGRLLGVEVDLTESVPTAERRAIETLPAPAERSLSAASRVTRWWPFCNGPCLRRALVGARLTRELQPSVRIGLAPSGSGIQAHAWLEIDGAPLEDVTGFTAFGQPSSAGGPAAP